MFNAIRRLILWLKATFAFRRVKRIERKQFTDEVISSNGTAGTFETHEVEIPEGPPTSAENRKAGKRTGLERTAEEESLEEVQIAESQIKSTPYQAEEEKEKETETNRPSEQVEISSKDMQERIKTTLTKRKPRTKIPPGELEKAGKLVRDKVKKCPSGREKERDLGHRKTKARKTTKSLDQAPVHTIRNKSNHNKEVSTRIVSPFIELSLDEAKVFLVLPEQKLVAGNTAADIPTELTYKVQLNGEEQSLSARVSKDSHGSGRVQEKRVELERPLEEFQVDFPRELGPSPYTYKHKNVAFYTFVAVGNNRGRMWYLYDKDGNVNPLTNRMVWFLVHEDYKLEIESNYLTEETWIWEKYRPLRVNLKEMNKLVIKNTKTSKEHKLLCEPTFSIEGQVIEDDFKEEMPLLIGGTLEIRAPSENPPGWTVWIQNRMAGSRVITENWSGTEPLSLKLPDDLPCKCGEFQVDICQQDTGIPDETLFFRWLPFIELNYPKELIIPNAHQGHKSEFTKVKISGEGWALNCRADLKVRLIESNFYKIELRPGEDTIRFSITKKGKPETNTKFQTTIPRFKWKTSKHEAWNGKLQSIKRDELIYGESFYLLVCSNDFNNKYDLSAILETDSQMLQEGKFTRQGINYNLELNQFYDTIKRNKNEITLKIKIWKAGGELVGSVEALQFPPEFELIKKEPRQKIRQEQPMPIFSYPTVKAGLGEKRRGKGFSRQEIITVGIDRSNIRRLNIPFDKRRKSSHDWNIKTLKSIIEGGKHAH